MPPALPTSTTTRRLLGRSLAAAAVTPLAAVASAAPAAAATERKAKRKWHRCKVHTKHTCWRATTCKHRKHKPAGENGQSGQHGGNGQQQQPTKPVQPTTPQTPVPLPHTDLPTAAALHLGNRFSYGMTPALHLEMEAAGGHEAWFEAQLSPMSLPDPVADQLQSWWASIDLDAPTLWQREKDKVEDTWVAMANYQRWVLLRRIFSRRQLLEQVTEVFENHLHVPVHDDGVFGFRSDYGKLIRSHALGRFDQMLVAAITHPAMGTSLDNAGSTKRAPNENLGRELLELHTVGRGNYTEDDVKNSAKILTGYRVDMWNSWRSWYDTPSHWTGPVQVMEFSHSNQSADGRAVAEAYLTYLARHPATAKRIARKLAIRFVSDEPSAGLVDHLTDVYLTSETAIVPVLRALVAHPEFAASAGAKIRTPTDDVVATYRALDIGVSRPTGELSAANTIVWQTTSVGASPHDWPRPDGQPERGSAWSSASRVLASFQIHYAMSGTWWPKEDLTYHPLASWVPIQAGQSIRFDDLVDVMSQQLLCRSANARVQEAARNVTNLSAGTLITTDHPLVRWDMPRLLTTLLDSPEHMTR